MNNVQKTPLFIKAGNMLIISLNVEDSQKSQINGIMHMISAMHATIIQYELDRITTWQKYKFCQFHKDIYIL